MSCKSMSCKSMSSKSMSSFRRQTVANASGAMRIRNIGMLLNPSPCQFAATAQHHAVIRRAHDLFAALVCFQARVLSGSCAFREEAESRRVLSTMTIMSGDPMKEFLPEGGVVRKLWIGETAKYRDHLLRLDAQS